MAAANVAKEQFWFKRLRFELQNLEVSSDKILHRKGDENNQVILPSKLKPLLFKELHIEMRHLGYDQTLEIIKERFFWPKMYDHVKYFLIKFVTALKTKHRTIHQQASIKTITSSSPKGIIMLEFLHLDTCTGGFQYLLTITDHFTGCTQVYPTRNKEAKTAVNKLFKD